jgi:hypothetical protein
MPLMQGTALLLAVIWLKGVAIVFVTQTTGRGQDLQVSCTRSTHDRAYV